MLDSRIQSAQMTQEMASSIYGGEKRVLSATEEQGKTGFSNFQNKLSKKAPLPNNDTYLEYSMTKKLDDFISNNFEGTGSYDNLENNMESRNRQGDIFSSVDTLRQQQDTSQNDARFKTGPGSNQSI